MNTAILVESLRFTNRNYEYLSRLSKWIYEELNDMNYSDKKLDSVLQKCPGLAKDIIHRTQNHRILSKSIVNCIKNGEYEIVKIMLEKGIRSQESLLKHVDKSLDLVDLLISYKQYQIDDISDLLYNSIIKDNLDMVIMLISKYQARLCHPAYHYALYHAVNNKNVCMVKLLIKNNYQATGYDLYNASINDCFEIVKTLVESGITKSLLTPKHILEIKLKGNQEIMILLNII